MLNIVCLGTMHTYGGTKTNSFKYYDTWPGHLSNYLDQKGIDNQVINGGESGYSINYYPSKIINFYNEYKPDVFVVELPIDDKMDVEISSAITGNYMDKQQDYHPIFSKQRVLTKNSQHGKPHGWPNRISMSKHEAIDHVLKDNKISVKNLFKGHQTNTIHSFVYNDGVGDHERQNVSNKVESLKNILGDDSKYLMYYLYFYSMYMDESDTDRILYMNNILNIINTCCRLQVEIILFNVNKPFFINTRVYKESYEQLIGHSKFWVNDISWFFKQTNPPSDDGMYIASQGWKNFCENYLGPKLLND